MTTSGTAAGAVLPCCAPPPGRKHACAQQHMSKGWCAAAGTCRCRASTSGEQGKPAAPVGGSAGRQVRLRLCKGPPPPLQSPPAPIGTLLPGNACLHARHQLRSLVHWHIAHSHAHVRARLNGKRVCARSCALGHLPRAPAASTPASAALALAWCIQARRQARRCQRFAILLLDAARKAMMPLAPARAAPRRVEHALTCELGGGSQRQRCARTRWAATPWGPRARSGRT